MTPPAPPLPLLWVLALASFASMASMRACDALLPQLATEFSVTTGAAAQTISAFAVAYGLVQVVYGPMGDRYGKARVIACAVLCCAAANLAVALAPTLDSTVAWRALAGAAAGGIVPLSIASIGDSVAYEQRQETLARLSLATIGGMIAGQWLGGVVADTWNWRVVFFILAASFAAVSWPVWRWALHSTQPLHTAQARASYPAQLAQLWRTPWARIVLVTTFIEGIFALAPFTFLPSHLHSTFGLSLGQAGAVTALYGLGGVAFALASRRLIARLGESGLVALGGLCLCLCMTTLAAAPAWGWATGACFIGGVGFYALHSTLQTHATQMMPLLRGTAISVFVVCLFGGQSVGVTLAAAVVDHASARWVFGASALSLAVLAYTFKRSLDRRHALNQSA